MTYSIKDVAEKTQLSAYVLRYYEKEGLLPRIQRTKGGIRYYTDEDVDLLGLICCLKNTGMPLRDIRTFVQLSEQGPATLAQRCEILRAQQQNVLRSIEELQRSYEKVSRKLEHFSELLAEYDAAEGRRDEHSGASRRQK